MELSAEECLRIEEHFDVASLPNECMKPVRSRYRKQSMIYGANRYCKQMHRDPVETFSKITIQMLYSFWHWVLTKRQGKIDSKYTLQTYWNVFCQLRKKAGCADLDPLIKSQMHGVRQQLAIKHQLTWEKKKKPIMRAEDEFELLKTLYLSPEMTFDHERHRIELALIMQLAGITGNRPGALLGLRYRDIKFTLLRDPAGGPIPRRLMEIEFTDTKAYLGQKESNEIGIPDIPHESCLLLCPQTALLALIFLDRAFDAPGLSSPNQLFQLQVLPGQNQLKIPVKQEIAHLPVFRRSAPSMQGSQISPDKVLTYQSLLNWMKILGEITGMELPTRPYTFRRGAGEAMDCSSFITEAQRNLILQHQNSTVFIKNYSSRYITGDLQAARRGLQPQTEILRAASGMSRSIDCRRPRKLTALQRQGIDHHPEVKLLRRQRNGLKARIEKDYRKISNIKGSSLHRQYQQLCKDDRNTRARVEQALLKEIKAKYIREQPIKDIQMQLENAAALSKQVTQEVEYAFKERKRAIDALFTFAIMLREMDGVAVAKKEGQGEGKMVSAENTEKVLAQGGSMYDECWQEERKRRVEAIEALMALGRLQEARQPRSKGRPPSRLKTESEQKAEIPIDTPTFFDRLPLKCGPTQCIFCLGNEGLPRATRLKPFHSPGDLKKHFHRKHFRHYPEDQAIACPHPRCSITFARKMFLQNHVEKVHGIKT